MFEWDDIRTAKGHSTIPVPISVLVVGMTLGSALHHHPFPGLIRANPTLVLHTWLG